MSLRPYINYIQPQMGVDCCTASATLLAVEIMMSTKGITLNFSRLFLYYMTRKLQGRLGKKGAELKTTLEALMQYGVPPERHWPFAVSRVETVPHPPAFTEAAHYRLLTYKWVLPDEFKEYLTKNIPIIVGLRTGKLFWNLSGEFCNHQYKPINNTDNPESIGHAVTIIGYDDTLYGGSWIIANSTGPKWGYQGYAVIPYSCNIDIGESYVITDFSNKFVG